MLLLTVVYKIGTLDPSMTFSLSIYNYNARAKVIHSFFFIGGYLGFVKAVDETINHLLLHHVLAERL